MNAHWLIKINAGKRYNVLRNRIDPWDYDVDQLLFGTILFTLVTFLFPTILAYYALFAMVSKICIIDLSCSINRMYQLRLTIILTHALTEAVLAFINHFPLFALVLRVKDPWRLPGMSKNILILLEYILKFAQAAYTLIINHRPRRVSLYWSQRYLDLEVQILASLLTDCRINLCHWAQFLANTVSRRPSGSFHWFLLTTWCSPIMGKAFVALSSNAPDELHPFGRVSSGHFPKNYTLRARQLSCIR